MKTSAHLLCLIFWLVAITSFGSPFRDAIAQADFDKPLYTFNLTIKNPNNAPVNITKVGVKSEVRSGSFNCMAGSPDSGILNILANYAVRFHVSAPETVKVAEPQIQIGPRESARLAVSLIPSAIGACGPWAVNVSAFVVFDNGLKVYSEPTLVTSADYAEYQPKKLDDEEVLKALKHLDSTVRAKAVRALPGSTIDRDSARLLLQSKLDDKDVGVRNAAAVVAATMDIKPLARKIASLLSTTQSSEEASVYSWALSKLRDPETIDTLVATFVNLSLEKPRLPYSTIEYNYSAKDALIKFQHPDVPAKLRPYLISRASWGAKGASEAQVKRYTDLCLILTAYRDKESVAQLVNALTKTPHEIVLGFVMRELYSSNEGLVQDPFVIALRAAFEAGLRHQNWNHRFLSISLLIGMQLDKASEETILRDGLRDSLPQIRTYAADLAAKLGRKSLVPEILALFSAATDDAEKANYCEALKALGASCN